MAGYVFVFGFIALAILLGVLNVRQSRSRAAALNDWALRNEWKVAPWPAVAWGGRMPGHNQQGVSLAVSGQLHGRAVTIAEYYYATTSTSPTGAVGETGAMATRPERRTHRYVLMVVRLRRTYPSIGVYRRGALSKLGRSLLGDKSTALGQEEFDRVFRVTADQPGLVSTVLSRDLVAAHVAGRLPDWSIEGKELLTYREGRLDDPTTIPAAFGPLLLVADLLEPTRTAD
jgi:hypothetical protein